MLRFTAQPPDSDGPEVSSETWNFEFALDEKIGLNYSTCLVGTAIQKMLDGKIVVNINLVREDVELYLTTTAPDRVHINKTLI